MNYKWTDAEIALLELLRADGASFSAIAFTLSTPTRKFTRNAVAGKIHRLGLSVSKEDRRPPPRTPGQIKRVA